MITLRHIYTLLFFAGLFFIPFNNFEGLSFLGEYKNEAASYFFLIGFGILCVDSVLKGKINLPYRNLIFQLVCLFILWTIIATLFNLPTVLDSYYKQTSGISRFVRQFISLTLSAFVFLSLFWNVVRKMSLEQILRTFRTVILAGLIFAFVYGVIETAVVVFGVGQLLPILKLFEFFPFVNVSLDNLGRISSVTYEVPSLGNYLITISAWMFSYIITEKSKLRFIPTLMVLFLMLFSGSRTALVNVTLQLLVFLTALYFSTEYRQQVIRLVQASLLVFGVLFIFNAKTIINVAEKKIESLDFTKKTEHDISNRTRFGMQYASLQIFKKNPITGVGLGQETYHKIYEYPNWATRDNWEFEYRYKNQQITSFPPTYNIYTRLLSETGIIGFGLFVYIVYLCISTSRKLGTKSLNEKEKALCLILLISFIGLGVNWLQTDFFRQYGVWFCMAILIKLIEERKKSIQTVS
ncbi:MAG: O-antigen ligase family protein [Flavobacteriaceae bacterium]